MKDITFKQTDCGRIPEEKLDCTVRAYAHFKGIPYYEAHELLRLAGRKNGKGFPMAKFMDVMGFSRRHLEKRMNVRNFIKAHSIGNFIVRVKSHVFNLMDGKIFDERLPNVRRFVTWYWDEKFMSNDNARKEVTI